MCHRHANIMEVIFLYRGCTGYWTVQVKFLQQFLFHLITKMAGGMSVSQIVQQNCLVLGEGQVILVFGKYEHVWTM